MKIHGYNQQINGVPVYFENISFAYKCMAFLSSHCNTKEAFNINILSSLVRRSTSIITKRLKGGKDVTRMVFDNKPPAFLTIDDESASLLPCNQTWRNLMNNQFTRDTNNQYVEWRYCQYAIMKMKHRKSLQCKQPLSLWEFNDSYGYEIKNDINALRIVHTMLSIYQWYKSIPGIYESNKVPWHVTIIKH